MYQRGVQLRNEKNVRKRSFIDVPISYYIEIFSSCGVFLIDVFHLDAFDLLNGPSSGTNRSNFCPKLGAILILVYKTSLMSLILVSDSYVFVNELLLLNRDRHCIISIHTPNVMPHQIRIAVLRNATKQLQNI